MTVYNPHRFREICAKQDIVWLSNGLPEHSKEVVMIANLLQQQPVLQF